MKKYLVLVIISLSLLSLVGCSSSEKSIDEELSEFTKEKYGFEVEYLDNHSYGSIGNGTYYVQRKDIPEVKFEMNVSGFINRKLTNDDYKDSYEFYLFNQKYLKSPLYEKFKNLGFVQSSLIGVSYENNSGKKVRTADLYLFTPNGFKMTNAELQALLESKPFVQEVENELSTIDYQLDEILINDTENAKMVLLNNLENYNYQNEIVLPFYLLSVSSTEQLKSNISTFNRNADNPYIKN